MSQLELLHQTNNFLHSWVLPPSVPCFSSMLLWSPRETGITKWSAYWIWPDKTWIQSFPWPWSLVVWCRGAFCIYSHEGSPTRLRLSSCWISMRGLCHFLPFPHSERVIAVKFGCIYLNQILRVIWFINQKEPFMFCSNLPGSPLSFPPEFTSVLKGAL